MKTRHKATVLLLLFIPSACLVLFALRPTEPKYNGKPLSFWITEYSSYSAYRNDARDAIKAIGTNAIPTLLRWLSYNPPHWRTKLAFLEHKILPSYTPALFYRADHDNAIQGFLMLGTNALPAVPALVKLMNQTNAPETAIRATYSLGCLGPQAVPYLDDALSSTNPMQRVAILSTIADIYSRQGGSAEDCFPALLKARFDVDPLVRRAATNNLNRIAPQVLMRYPVR